MNALQRIILVLDAVAIVVAYFAAPWVYEMSNLAGGSYVVATRSLEGLDHKMVYRDYRVFLPQMLAISAITAMLCAAARGVRQSGA